MPPLRAMRAVALTVAEAGRYIRQTRRTGGGRAASGVSGVRGLMARVRSSSEADMLGEGEGLELIGVFVTFIAGLAIMVVLGKWWEA